jgi:hypothetical protein
MADCLAYWKTYWEYGPSNAKEHSLTTGWGSMQMAFLDRISEGDTLWVVGRSQDDTDWRLLQRLHVARTYTNGEGSQRVVADPSRSAFFVPEIEVGFEERLRQLRFASNRPITGSGKLIGRNIQTIRPLSKADVALLEDYAKHLNRC